MLDRLFDTDRASLITTTVLGVIRAFNIDTSQLHNDSTTVTVTVTGNYPTPTAEPAAGNQRLRSSMGTTRTTDPTSSNCCSS
jgi:hypothetical protein